MTVDALLDALTQRGIIATYNGGRLHIDAPAGSFSPDLQVEVRRHRDEIVKRLSTRQEGEPTPNDTIPAAEWTERTDADGWRILERSGTTGLEIIAPPPPCGKCGRLDLWQDVAGGWHCLRCDPPTVARRLRREAARIRQRYAGVRRREGLTGSFQPDPLEGRSSPVRVREIDKIS